METKLEEVLKKYDLKYLKSLDVNNMRKILEFLIKENCDFIIDILENYLDLLSIDYDTFREKYCRLNLKYHYEYMALVRENMNYLEEMY